MRLLAKYFAFAVVCGVALAGCAAQAQCSGGDSAANPPKVARISAGVMAGQIVRSVPPVYPEDAKAAGVAGTVTLHAIIGRDGMVQNLVVVSGPDMLQGAAMDAVKQWEYRPYMLNGEPVEVETTIMVNFNLAGRRMPEAQ